MQFVVSKKTIIGLWPALFATLGAVIGRESRLVSRAQQGDLQAFDEIRKSFERPVRAFISRRVKDADRDDVIQETWIQAWDNLSKFQYRDGVKPWLLTIAYRRIQDYYRRETARPVLLTLMEDIDHAYWQPQFTQAELRRTLEPFWKTCTQEQKELIAMYYGDGLTLAQIATITHKNLSTVKYQFYKLHELAATVIVDEPVLNKGSVTA